jgi:hypothetical protein
MVGAAGLDGVERHPGVRACLVLFVLLGLIVDYVDADTGSPVVVRRAVATRQPTVDRPQIEADLRGRTVRLMGRRFAARQRRVGSGTATEQPAPFGSRWLPPPLRLWWRLVAHPERGR